MQSKELLIQCAHPTSPILVPFFHVCPQKHEPSATKMAGAKMVSGTSIHFNNFKLINKHFNIQNKSTPDFLTANHIKKYLQYNSLERLTQFTPHGGILRHFGTFRRLYQDIFTIITQQLNINDKSTTIDFDYIIY